MNKSLFILLSLLTSFTIHAEELDLGNRLIGPALGVAMKCGSDNPYYTEISDLEYDDNSASFNWSYLGKYQGSASFNFALDDNNRLVIANARCL